MAPGSTEENREGAYQAYSSHRKPSLRIVLAVGVGGVLVLIASLYWLWGHSLLEAMYRGTAPRVLRDLIRARDRLPVEYYLRRADSLFWGGWTLAVTVTGLAFLSRRWIRVGALSRAEIMMGLGIVVFCGAPWPLLKVLAASATAAYLAGRSPVLDRYQAGTALFTLCALAFVVAPYWTVFGPPWARGIALVLLVALAGGWAYLTASPTRLWEGRTGATALLALALVLWLVNDRTLHVDLPVRTDESYHVASILILGWQPAWWLVVVVAILVARDSRRDHQSMAIRYGVLALTCVVAGLAYRSLMSATELARYPLVNRWLELAPIQALLPFGTLGWEEALFRLPSLLSVIGLAWVVYAYHPEGWPRGGILLALAVATTPVLLYYSSILYLEPAAVLLMTICCLDSERLLREDRGLLWTRGSGIALLLVGFIKETTLPFLLAFVVCRVGSRVWRCPTMRRVRDEGIVAIAVLGPLGAYLLLRVGLGGAGRSYGAHVANLAHAGLYAILLRSWVEQFAGLAVLAALGVAVLTRRRQWRALSFFGLALGMTAVFFVMDSTDYLGYSRFNLLFAPVLVALAVAAASALARRSRLAVVILAVGWLAGNAVWSPLRLDGSRDARWRGPLIDDVYPYREALTWLARNRTGDRILFAGLPAAYPVVFYFVKLRWHPPVEMLPWRPEDGFREALLGQALERARRSQQAVVVYHLLRDERVPENVDDRGFSLAKVFANQVHRLAVYVE